MPFGASACHKHRTPVSTMYLEEPFGTWLFVNSKNMTTHRFFGLLIVRKLKKKIA